MATEYEGGGPWQMDNEGHITFGEKTIFDIEQDQIQSKVERIEDLLETAEEALRGTRLTNEQFLRLRAAWVNFAMVLAPAGASNTTENADNSDENEIDPYELAKSVLES